MPTLNFTPDPNAAGMQDDDLLAQEILKHRAIKEAQAYKPNNPPSTTPELSDSEKLSQTLEALAPKKYEINPELANYLTQMRAGKDEAAAAERRQNSLFQAFDAVGQARANEWGNKYSPIGDTGDSAQKAALAAEGAVDTANLKDIQGHIDRRGDIARALASKRDGSNLSRTFLKESKFVTENGKPVMVYNDPNTGVSRYFDSSNNPISEDQMISSQKYGMLEGQKIEQEKNTREKAAKIGTEIVDFSSADKVFEDIDKLLPQQTDNRYSRLEDVKIGESVLGPTVKGADLPGVTVPLFGRYSTSVTDPGGQKNLLESKVEMLKSLWTKIQSGLTVTEAERKAIAAGLEQMNTATEGEKIRGLQAFKEVMTRNKDAKLKQFGPEAREKYLADQARMSTSPQSSGVTGSFEAPTQPQQSTPTKPKTVMQNGKTFILNEETGKYERQK